MSPPGIKAGYNLPLLVLSKWELSFIPVPPGLLHPYNRQHFNLISGKFSNPQQVIKHLPLLKPQLLLIAHCLKLTPPALFCYRTQRLCPAWRRLQHLHQTGKAIGLLHFHSLSPNYIPHNRILNKPDVPIYPAHSSSVLIHILYGNHELLIFLHISILPLTK